MSDLRIQLGPVDPKAPGTLEFLSICLREQSAPVLEPILKFVLEKWTSLFTIRILCHAISGKTLLLLAFVPAVALGAEEAQRRCEAFDAAQRARRDSLGISCRNYRNHNWPAEKLRNLSHFMRVFTHDLGQFHRDIPNELRKRSLKPGMLLFRGRFRMRTVSHEALPPVEGWMDEKELEKTCEELDFKTPAAYAKQGEMFLSDYAFGPKEFVDAVLDARNRALLGKGRLPKYRPLLTLDGREDRRRIPRTAPLDAAAFIRRFGELAEVPGGWSPPGWLETFGDTAHDLKHDLGRSISWGLEDLLVHRATTHSVMLPYSVPAWFVAALMDGMVRVYYWQRQRKLEKEQEQKQAQEPQAQAAVSP